MNWSQEMEKQIKAFLKKLIDETPLYPQDIKIERAFLDPRNNLVEFGLFGPGTLLIELKGGNLYRAMQLFEELEEKKESTCEHDIRAITQSGKCIGWTPCLKCGLSDNAIRKTTGTIEVQQ